MRIIARIPEIMVQESAPPSAPRSRERVVNRGGVSQRWPTWQAAALAVVAAAIWVVASWNDHARLQRQRAAVRVAREPAVGGPVAETTGGAVVR